MASKVRAHILKAAEEEFARCGFSGSSTRSIAKAAGVHETSIFRLFDNKESLFRIVFDDILQRMSDAPPFLGPGWKQPLIEFAKAIRNSWTPATSRIFLFALLELDGYYSAIVKHWRPLLGPILQRVIELQASGHLRQGDPRRMTEAIGDAIWVWYLLPMTSDHHRKGSGLPPTKQPDFLMGMFLDGLRNNSQKKASTR